MRSINKMPSSDGVCQACGKSYSTKGNLKKHHKRQPQCLTWIDMLKRDDVMVKQNQAEIFDYNILKNIQYAYSYSNVEKRKEEKKEKEKSTECDICRKKFSNVSNLGKHIERSLICKKWRDYNFVKTLSETKVVPMNGSEYENHVREIDTINDVNVYENQDALIKMTEMNNADYDLTNTIDGEHVIKINENGYPHIVNTGKNERYEKFEPIKDKLIHVIWNLYLVDKQTKIDKEILDKNKVGYILAILPTKDEFKKHHSEILNEVPYFVMEYGDIHKDVLDNDTIDTYKNQCNIIDTIAKQNDKSKRNVFIFCNNGYQRSIPFICFYLMKYHPEEISNLSQALDQILPQINKETYMKEKDTYMERIPKLFLNVNN